MTVGVIWGMTFLFMRWATDVVSPAQTALIRVVFGALPVAVYALVRGHLSWSHWRHAHHFLAMSILAAAFYYYAFAVGTTLLETGIAGALTGTIPLFATVSASLMLADERMNRGRAVGLVAGVGGVVLLAQPWDAGSVDLAGVGWMLAGCVFVGLSFPYARRFITPLEIHPSAATTYQLVLGGILLLVVVDLDGITDVADDPKALLGTVLGLGLLCTGIAFILYYVMVDGLGAATASTSSYLPPAVAMVVGIVALDEPIHASALAGLTLIGLGAFVSHRFGTAIDRTPVEVVVPER
ncbi:Permease of the drug/metabolite transporter (DMT) superfamily [Aeromicrobium choanae]|uniref:Permease of the drug/metabolite transporter (DMT) superfamily n=1 Tax=Aeromicrobium choanae TaxID=1736691 RepID=A0A1T4ZA38_9ACTN|nr:Permease of the drug/metabolite transporter (DMT) superfamily [Aeromicrobium choanae]